MVEAEVQEQVRADLSASRFAHTEGVVTSVTELAERFGADVQQARVAAWLHDMAREWPTSRLQQAAEKVDVPNGFAVLPGLLHGPIAAALAIEWFGIDDDVANAIRFHTTGRVGMTRLEKVVCLADAIEPGRVYPGVQEIRSTAREHLELALAKSFDATLRYLIESQQPIFPLTVMARNEFWEQSGGVRA